MLVLRKRLFELFVTSITISVIIVSAFLLGIIPGTEYNAAFVCILGSGIFMGINIRQLQRCMVDLASLKIYYKYNYLSYMIFAMVSTGICIFTSVEFFSILFSFTKFVRYANMAVSYEESLLIFHAVMLLIITVVPFFLPKRYRKRILARLEKNMPKKCNRIDESEDFDVLEKEKFVP